MHDTRDEMHDCPCCGRRTPHLVMRERKLAPVMWCQHCHQVRIEPQAERNKSKERAANKAA